MKDHKETPTPGQDGYQVEKTESLNKPKFNSTTERRSSDELPAVEHKDDHASNDETLIQHDLSVPKTDLGNDRDDEKENEDEKIIRT